MRTVKLYELNRSEMIKYSSVGSELMCSEFTDPVYNTKPCRIYFDGKRWLTLSGTPVTFTVTTKLTNCHLRNELLSISYNSGVNIDIIPDEGYAIDTHSVRVGDVVAKANYITREKVCYGLRGVNAAIEIIAAAVPIQD